MLREPAGDAAELVVEPLPVGDVLREGLLLRDRAPLGRGLERPRIDPPRPVAQQLADLAARERVALAERREAPDRLDPGGAQALVGAWPDPRQDSQRQRREEGSLPP